MTSKYLITGSTGFIGYHLVNRLCKDSKNIVYGIDSINSYYTTRLKKIRLRILKKNRNFSFKKLNMTNKKQLSLEINKINPNYIIHLAGQPGVMYSFKNPKSYLKNNLIATKNLINIIRHKNLKKFIFGSSSSVYGEQKKYPIKENSSLNPKNYYALTKKKCEEIILNDKKLNNKSIIFRFFTVYGPLSRPDMFVSIFLKNLKKNKTTFLYNKGNHFRDYTYVDDIVEFLIKSLKKRKNIFKKKIYNICASRPKKIIDLVGIMGRNLNIRPSIKFMPKRKGEMLKTYGSNNKLLKEFGKKKFTRFEIGIKKTIKYFKKYNY